MAGDGKFPMAPATGSSAIMAHGYDVNSRKMRVQFKGPKGVAGHTYELDDVPSERYAAFSGAKSMGEFYGKKISPLHIARKVKS